MHLNIQSKPPIQAFDALSRAWPLSQLITSFYHSDMVAFYKLIKLILTKQLA